MLFQEPEQQRKARIGGLENDGHLNLVEDWHLLDCRHVRPAPRRPQNGLCSAGNAMSPEANPNLGSHEIALPKDCGGVTFHFPKYDLMAFSHRG